MRPDEVRARIEQIRAVGDDYERAHSKEDSLLWDVIAHFADWGLHWTAQSDAIEIVKLLQEWHEESADAPRWCA